MNSFRKCLSLVVLLLALLPGLALAQTSFRIFPYLQVADQNLVQVRWFSDQDYPASISFRDSKGNVLASSNVSAKEMPALYYTGAEKTQSISGLEGQNWIGGDKYYRYEYALRVPYRELISYEVILNGQRFSNLFKSAPDPQNWEKIRFIALSDSETEPRGRVTNRAWYPGKPLIRPFAIPELWKQKFGITLEQGFEIPNYFLTEAQGYKANLEIIEGRNPDFMVMPGDLVQGGGYMPAWDEFWRHNSGEFGAGLSAYPIIPAIGNWENFGALNNGYGTNDKGQFNPIVGRSRFHSFFEIDIEDPLQKHRQSYYRTDYGPITILTLDSSNGTPEEKRSDTPDDQKLKNKEFSGPGTDTQENFTQAQYNAAGGTDLSGFGPGTPQYLWLEANLKEASETKRLIFVQFHHVPYGSGEHGVPMNHELSTGQGGTPLRVLHPLFEQYGVIAVLAGHDELFERSFVDEDADGKGVHYYDVGVAGDGLRGAKRNWISNPLETLDYNQYSQWTADQKSIELWNTAGSNPILTDGGKHYGHLEVNLKKLQDGGKTYAQIDFEPVYIFPVMDQNYNLQRIERRVYNDPLRILVELEEVVIEPIFKKEITLELDENGKAVTTFSDYLENELQEDWKVEFSRSPEYSCEDVEGTENEVKVSDSKGNSWSAVVLVKVLDKTPPFIVVGNATLTFDISEGVAFLDPWDFLEADFLSSNKESVGDNCTPYQQLIYEVFPASITCSDLNEDGTYTPKEIEIRVKDRFGNATSGFGRLNLTVVESKKISISKTPLENSYKLLLGKETEFEVIRWVRSYQGSVETISSKQKELLVNQSGDFYAVIRLASGCLSRSETSKVAISISEDWPVAKSEISLTLDATGKALLEPSDLFDTWPVEPEGLVFDLSKREFTCENLGENEIVLTLKKASGESRDYPVTILVKDETAPILTTKIPDLAFDLVKGKLELNPEDFVATLSDNCEIKSLTLNRNLITCENFDSPIELILTAVDLSGNSTSEVLNVSVSPFESKKISISPESGTEFQEGESAEIRLGDEYGFTLIGWYRNGELIQGEKGKAILTEQSGTYWARVISNDGGCEVESDKTEIKFTALPYGEIKESITLILGPEGKADLSPSDVFVTWPPADPTLEVTLSKTIFTCEDIGEKVVGILIKNQAGQTWEESIKVIVKDQTPPVLVPKNLTLNLDVSKGVVEITPEMVLAEFGDNCGIKSLTINKNRFTCEDVGKEFSIAIRAEDNSGNVSESVSKVNIERLESDPVVLTGNSQICEGEGSLLTLSSSLPFEVVRWRRNGAEIQGQTGKSLEVSESGVYHAVIRHEGGCLSESNALEVKVNPLPSGEIVVDGTILRAPEGDYTYQWFRNEEVLSGQTGRTFTAQLMGDYTVELTSPAGCSQKLKPVTLTISGLFSRPTIPAKQLKIYPNPASDRVTIEFADGVLATQPIISIYSSEGKNLTSMVDISVLSDSEVEIFVSRLAKGIYHISAINHEQKSYFAKLIIVN